MVNKNGNETNLQLVKTNNNVDEREQEKWKLDGGSKKNAKQKKALSFESSARVYEL